jgi:hypothetical protein
MIPPNVAALIPISVREIQATAGMATELRNALQIAQGVGDPRGTFFRFVNSMVKASPSISRSEAAQSYRAAQYWQQQGNILSQYGPDIPLDTELARIITGKGAYAGTAGLYRSQVDVTVEDKETGESRQYSMYIRHYADATLDDLYAQAVYELDYIIGESPGPGGHRAAGFYNLSFAIVDFGFYT